MSSITPACGRAVDAGASLDRLPQQEQPNPTCTILLQPIEVLLLVADHLPPASRVLLSQTCRSIRAALGNPSSKSLSRRDFVDYLSGLARSLLSRWVCDVCHALHPVLEADTPRNARQWVPWLRHTSCPLGSDAWEFHCYGRESRNLDRRPVPYDHRHIQLALKYTRTNDRQYQSYLYNLLMPLHANAESYGQYWSGQGYHEPNAIQYSTYPKIVAVPRGLANASGELRFLLNSVWHYRQYYRPVSIDSMSSLRICPHLDFRIRYLRDSGDLLQVLISALTSAFEAAGEAVISEACPRCPTDFSVKASAEYACVRVWQDLGSETSPLDVAWRIHVWDTRDVPLYGGINAGSVGPTICHEPGSIQKLYGTLKLTAGGRTSWIKVFELALPDPEGMLVMRPLRLPLSPRAA